MFSLIDPESENSTMRNLIIGGSLQAVETEVKEKDRKG